MGLEPGTEIHSYSLHLSFQLVSVCQPHPSSCQEAGNMTLSSSRPHITQFHHPTKTKGDPYYWSSVGQMHTPTPIPVAKKMTSSIAGQ